MYIMACYLFIIKILHADNSFLFFFMNIDIWLTFDQTKGELICFFFYY
jgi:hypothetical protein